MFFTRNIVVIVVVANAEIWIILSKPLFKLFANLSKKGVFSSKGTKTSEPG